MTEQLVQELTADPERSTRLTELMNACRNEYRYVSVLVIGCGDAFINRYWPKLQLLVNRGRIILTVVDIQPINSLVNKNLRSAKKSGEETDSFEKLRGFYRSLQRMLREEPTRIKYLDMSDKDDRISYEQSIHELVFVLVPDDIHIRYAKEWIRKSKLILIEKPYNRDLVEAENFEQTLKGMIELTGGRIPHTFGMEDTETLRLTLQPFLTRLAERVAR